MEFNQFKTICLNVESNISVLERELSDFSKYFYQTDDSCQSGGIEVLKNLSEEWEKLCKEIEELNQQDEADICEMTKQVEANILYVAELEERQQEYENILIQHNLLEPDSPSQPQGDLEHDVSSYEKFLHERKPFMDTKAPQTVDSPVNSTFLVARVPGLTISQPQDFNKENLSELQNTICDFQQLNLKSKKPL
uniref:Uncharacterized protein n=1 Tax=Graphocephala atropunctata TaxID=36148 RepID=A0A1B6LM65_9HEMI